MRPAIRFVARLYPVSWRDRYGREFNALVDDVNPGWRDLLDVLGRGLELRVATWGFRKIVAACVMAGALFGGVLSPMMPDQSVSIAAIRVHAAQQPVPAHPSVLSIIDIAWNKAVTRDSLVGLIERNHLYERERASRSMDYATDRIDQRMLFWTVPG